MTGKRLTECKYCGLTIPKEKRREHLTKIHKISVVLKGWIGKHFRESKPKHGWKKPQIIDLEWKNYSAAGKVALDFQFLIGFTLILYLAGILVARTALRKG